MCLLVQQTTSSNFTDEFLADVFNKNQDGLGVMYAEDDKLHIFKCLPANAQEFIGFYRAHAEGKSCVWHARMQTHGDIDFDNCHPYMVTSDVWLAHNGILSTGNAADKTKSDTWHFIKNFIRPALIGNPELLTDPEWQKFVGEIIGRSNKFALVRNDGEIVVINASAGVNYENAWLSNTYAWSYYKFTNNGGYTNMYSGYGGSRSHWATATITTTTCTRATAPTSRTRRQWPRARTSTTSRMPSTSSPPSRLRRFVRTSRLLSISGRAAA